MNVTFKKAPKAKPKAGKQIGSLVWRRDDCRHLTKTGPLSGRDRDEVLRLCLEVHLLIELVESHP